MSNNGRPEFRFAYRAFITLNILLAVYNMVCFHLPRNDINPCVLMVVNETRTVIRPPATDYNYSKPQFQNRQPLQSKQTFTNPLSTVAETRGAFVVHSNYIVGDENVGYDSTVTLTTQATHDFLGHTPTLCRRWQGPVSVSLYASGTDYDTAINKVLFLRACSDPCVRANVTWHIVYHREHTPKTISVKTSRELLAQAKPNCSDDIMEHQFPNYRAEQRMTYPINVLRNAARRAAKTRYIMASDIELYPSGNIIPRFLSMVRRRKNSTTPQVYVLPIFEVKASLRAPLTKKVLVEMMRNKSAVFFHKWVCEECQKFPRRDEWLKNLPEENALDVFTTTKRDKSRRSWEPIYIGTNAEPFYAEELTWEGKRDKMAQSYQLCLMGYDFNILDNAFLVHAPGIKTIVASEEKRRAPFVKVNNMHHARLMNYLKSKYAKGAPNC